MEVLLGFWAEVKDDLLHEVRIEHPLTFHREGPVVEMVVVEDIREENDWLLLVDSSILLHVIAECLELLGNDFWNW